MIQLLDLLHFHFGLGIDFIFSKKIKSSKIKSPPRLPLQLKTGHFHQKQRERRFLKIKPFGAKF
jgi:hypothetical protein